MGTHSNIWTRRRALAASAVGIASAAGLTAIGGDDASGAPLDRGEKSAAKGGGPKRMPVVFIPHGGGPWPFVDLGMDPTELDSLADYLRRLPTSTKDRPSALLVISAHWEERVPTLMTHARPPLLYDYYGFPPESYQITWPAPGAPELAARVEQLLASRGIESTNDAARGFDHGTFVPLKLSYPEADIPVLQLSLQAGLDPSRHLALGRALAPLRDEGVFIVGSGMSYHNMRGFRDPRARPIAESFDAWLRETATLESSARDRRLAAWTEAPGARGAHPREEHLMPLMVIAGAAGDDRGDVAWNGTVMGMRVSALHFG